MSVAELEAPMTVSSDTLSLHRNLMVKGHGRGFYFGSLRSGEVLPQWEAELSGSSAEELVAAGILEWTNEPVTRNVRAPIPKDDSDPAPAMAEELDRLRRSNVELRAENKAFAARDGERERHIENMKKALGEATTENTRLRTLADGYAIELKEVNKKLDEAMTPVSPLAPKVEDTAAKKPVMVTRK